MPELSDHAASVLGDAGCDILDENPHFARDLLLAIARYEPAAATSELGHLLAAVRAGRYFDVNIEEPAENAAPWVAVTVDADREILDELRAVTFDGDAAAASFALEYITG